MSTKVEAVTAIEGRLITLHCHIKGVVPTIMSNGQMAEETNWFAMAAKAVRKEKKRGDVFTMEQEERYYKYLFLGQLYLMDAEAMSTPYWPAENIEAMVRAGAKKSRDGQKALVGVTVVDDAPLIYDGPQEAEGLWEDKRFVFKSRIGGPNGTTTNCRARFQQWELEFAARLDTRMADKETFVGWLTESSWQVGLSAWHPKYGRFEVLSVTE